VEFALGPSLMCSVADGVTALPPPDAPVISRHVVHAVGHHDDGRPRSAAVEALLCGVARQSWAVLGSPGKFSQ